MCVRGGGRGIEGGEWDKGPRGPSKMVGRVSNIPGCVNIYYPTEVRRGKYWGLGVFLLQYFP